MTSKLAEYRKTKGLSQDDLAQASGLTKTTIQNWENGRNLGAVARILKVCVELNVDIRELFVFIDDEPIEPSNTFRPGSFGQSTPVKDIKDIDVLAVRGDDEQV